VPTINKQYEILPTNDNGLNATLRCHYFDAELNGLSETDLIFIKSTASPYTTFTNQNYTTRSATANYVEKTGINDLSLWAITSATTPLPLTLLSFNGKCDDNMAILYWQTANERNISRYTIQQSIDAVKWAVIGELDAKNNVHDYEYRTENVGDYYRLCIFDQDGSYTYSNVLKVHCEQNNSDNLTIYPNPTRDNINLNINTATNSLMHVRVYTANGALAYSAEQQLQSGSQILTLPIENLATGNYLINASWGNGQYNKTFKLVKQ
jgi:hypothetical protein